MAYRQSYTRGRFSSRSRYYRRGTGTRFVAKRYSNRVNGREVPYYLPGGSEAHVSDLVINHGNAVPVSSDTSAHFTLLNAIDRGTGIFDRESQRASMRFLLLRLRYALNSITFTAAASRLASGPITVRVMLVYATRQLATISVSDFLTSPGGSTLFATSGVQRIDSRENLQILYDNKFVMRNQHTGPTASAGETLVPTGDFTYRDLDIRIPINRPVSYTSSSISNVTLADITSGSLHLVTLYDNIYNAPNNLIGTSGFGSSRLVFSP